MLRERQSKSASLEKLKESAWSLSDLKEKIDKHDAAESDLGLPVSVNAVSTAVFKGLDIVDDLPKEQMSQLAEERSLVLSGSFPLLSSFLGALEGTVHRVGRQGSAAAGEDRFGEWLVDSSVFAKTLSDDAFSAERFIQQKSCTTTKVICRFLC